MRSQPLAIKSEPIESMGPVSEDGIAEVSLQRRSGLRFHGISSLNIYGKNMKSGYQTSLIFVEAAYSPSVEASDADKHARRHFLIVPLILPRSFRLPATRF